MKMQKAFKQKIALLLAVMLLCTLGITPSFGFISKADNTDATPTDATEGPYMIGADGTIYEEEHPEEADEEEASYIDFDIECWEEEFSGSWKQVKLQIT